MMRLKRILLPTNYSELAAHAAGYARALAEEYGATLFVLHAFPPVLAAVPAIGVAPGTDVLIPMEPASTDEMETFVREHLNGLSAPLVTEVRTGSPVSVITDYAREMAVDLIVIGTHARGRVKSMLLGSVSKAVLEHAGCAVLMVPLAAFTAEEPRQETFAFAAPERTWA